MTHSFKVGKRYLNSGLFIGYASDVDAVLNHHTIADDDDDQLYYTKVFLDEHARNMQAIELDTVSFIFQSLHGVEADIEMFFNDENGAPIVHNVPYHTYPIAVHGNGLAKWKLNYLGNYIGGQYNLFDGCTACRFD